MIEVEGLTKLYGEFVAVSELSFTVRPGELLGLVGPNGAGKTSTLRCLAGIIPPSHGRIRIAGHDLALDPVPAKQQLAFFPDEPRLFDYLSVRQHLEFTARLYQVADAETRIGPLLTELELTDKVDHLPAELSRGMKQKVALACGLIHSPKVVFFDEPLTGLDPLAIRRMKDTIRQLGRDGAAIVISSHLLHLLEEVCTHVLILKKGLRVAYGTLDEVRQTFALEGSSLEEVFIRIALDESPVVPPRLPPTAS
ncbi:MAG: ABC transporter ATP-binding protein [Verrucomicrobia bacterium]|nr:ABC transporter ATP-binding protein [Verrucomicrobiota bacterium]